MPCTQIGGVPIDGLDCSDRRILDIWDTFTWIKLKLNEGKLMLENKFFSNDLLLKNAIRRTQSRNRTASKSSGHQCVDSEVDPSSQSNSIFELKYESSPRKTENIGYRILCYQRYSMSLITRHDSCVYQPGPTRILKFEKPDSGRTKFAALLQNFDISEIQEMGAIRSHFVDFSRQNRSLFYLKMFDKTQSFNLKALGTYTIWSWIVYVQYYANYNFN